MDRTAFRTRAVSSLVSLVLLVTVAEVEAGWIFSPLCSKKGSGLVEKSVGFEATEGG